MQQITRTVTTKGQVTIPKQIRERLGIEPSGKVTFIVDDAGRVELRPTKYAWKDLRGIVPPIPGRESVDFRDFFEEAFQERADELMSGRRE
jgi:antitoxin PrlF